MSKKGRRGERPSVKKQTKGADKDMCVHRVALTSYCKRCGA